MKHYQVNEIFYSLQGEGARAGSANVFIRFSGCNMKCDVEAGPLSPGGFACDTEFVSGRALTAVEIAQEAVASSRGVNAASVIFTGGEPGLQMDVPLFTELRKMGFVNLCAETNGTIDLEPLMLDWISCSPKVAEHAMKLKRANELRYVMHAGKGIPRPSIPAQHYFLSPAFEPDGSFVRANLEWTVRMCKENPLWKLSVQQHKTWGLR